MQMVELRALFLAALAGRRAANTLAAHRRDLARVLPRLPGTATAIRPADLERALEADSALSPATRARRQASIRTLFAWAHRMGYLASNPAFPLDRVLVPERAPRPLTVEQTSQILRAIPPAQLRDRLLFTILRDTGVRVGEALSLRWEDLRLVEGDEQFRVLGKGNRERTVFLHAAPDSLRLLRRYGQDRPRSGYLFQGDPRRGGGAAPLDYSTVRYAWRRYCARARVPATIHQLRHTFVTELVRANVRLVTVQRLAGHRRLETTRRYAAVSDAEVKRELSDARRAPRPR